MKYIVLVTDNDGTETAYGPWPEAKAEERATGLQRAYPQTHVRVLPLLTLDTNEIA